MTTQCAKAEYLLSLVVDSGVSDPDTRWLERHLGVCQTCLELFEGMLLVRAVEQVAHAQWGRPMKRSNNPRTIIWG